jgi:uncharacterized membrane protein YfcA
MLVVTALLILLAGLAIGATGIGGILVVPALSGLAGLDVAQAVAASSFGFLFTGAAALLFQRAGAPRGSGRRLLLLYGCAFAGAAVGAWLAHLLPVVVLRVGVAALAIVSGVHALLSRTAERSEDDAQALPGGIALAVLGLLVGIGSALSGTGGPVLLLPVFMLIGVPIRAAIVAAQGIQLPVALAATAVHAGSGRLDWTLGALVGVALLVGWWAGSRLGARVPVYGLKRAVAFCLIATGLWYGWTSR